FGALSASLRATISPFWMVKYLGVPFSPVFPSQPSKSLPLKSFTGFSLAGNLTDEDQSSASDKREVAQTRTSAPAARTKAWVMGRSLGRKTVVRGSCDYFFGKSFPKRPFLLPAFRSILQWIYRA